MRRGKKRARTFIRALKAYFFTSSLKKRAFFG